MPLHTVPKARRIPEAQSPRPKIETHESLRGLSLAGWRALGLRPAQRSVSTAARIIAPPDSRQDATSAASGSQTMTFFSAVGHDATGYCSGGRCRPVQSHQEPSPRNEMPVLPSTGSLRRCNFPCKKCHKSETTIHFGEWPELVPYLGLWQKL